MMNDNTKDRPKSRSTLLIVLTVIVVGAVLTAGVAARMSRSNEAVSEMPTFTVRQGPLTISVIQSGTIHALEQEIIKSEVEGQTTIIFLIPEGTIVKKGDLLVQLDASKLEDNLVDQQIRVQNAEAAFIRARENLAVVKNQAKSDISKAELDLQFAREDVPQYVEGEYPKEEKELQSRIKLAEEELERATEKLEWSQRLFEEKYISQTELEADRLTLHRAKLDLELSKTSLSLLKDYTSKRRLAQLNSDVEQAEMALERVKLRTGADIVQAEAELRANEAEFHQEQSKQAKIEEQITKTKIVASREGLVVYATSAQAGRHGRSVEPLDEGQSVRERQELIYLPTANAMMAEIQLHESNLDKVKIGMPVVVTVDAVPGKTFAGHVAKIAPLPDARSMWMNPDLKVYPTRINLEGDNRGLHTGMSCQAEIVIDQYTEATYVPIQAVLQIGHQPTVYLRKGNGMEPQPVEIGLDNNRMIRVVSGLEPGQEVVLTPPLEDAATPDEEKLAVDEDMQERIRAAKAQQRSREKKAPVGQPGDSAQHRGTDGAHEAEAGHGESEQGRRPPDGEQGRRWGGNMTDEQREQMRKRFENMTPEQREEMRKRFQNMSPEEREKMRQRRGQGWRGGGDEGGGGRRGGGEAGGGRQP